jgi:hypothetical protein
MSDLYILLDDMLQAGQAPVRRLHLLSYYFHRNIRHGRATLRERSCSVLQCSSTSGTSSAAGRRFCAVELGQAISIFNSRGLITPCSQVPFPPLRLTAPSCTPFDRPLPAPPKLVSLARAFSIRVSLPHTSIFFPTFPSAW